MCVFWTATKRRRLCRRGNRGRGRMMARARRVRSRSDEGTLGGKVAKALDSSLQTIYFRSASRVRRRDRHARDTRLERLILDVDQSERDQSSFVDSARIELNPDEPTHPEQSQRVRDQPTLRPDHRRVFQQIDPAHSLRDSRPRLVSHRAGGSSSKSSSPCGSGR